MRNKKEIAKCIVMILICLVTLCSIFWWAFLAKEHRELESLRQYITTENKNE